MSRNKQRTGDDGSDDNDNDDGGGGGGSGERGPRANHPSGTVACDGLNPRPPAVRRGVANARKEAATDLEPGAVATPHDLLLQASQAATDAAGSLNLASVQTAYAAARATNPGNPSALRDAHDGATDAMSEVGEAADAIEVAANSIQAALDDIHAAMADLADSDHASMAAKARAALESLPKDCDGRPIARDLPPEVTAAAQEEARMAAAVRTALKNMPAADCDARPARRDLPDAVRRIAAAAAVASEAVRSGPLATTTTAAAAKKPAADSGTDEGAGGAGGDAAE